MENYATLRKDKFMQFSLTWMDLEIHSLSSEVNQKERDRHRMITLIVGVKEIGRVQ